jgi:lipid-A-disaccharide synthase
VEIVRSREERNALRVRFGIKEGETVIALLPGSRRSEIQILAPRLTEAAELLSADRPVRCIAVVPRELGEEARAAFPETIEVVTDCASDLLRASDGAIVKTGTASLEAVLAGTPHVAVYDVSMVKRAEWVLLWAWKRIPFFAMPNIILQRKAVPELLGRYCTPRKIADALSKLLSDEPTRQQMLKDYALIRKAVGSELPVPPTERTAQILEEMLRETERSAAPAAAI